MAQRPRPADAPSRTGLEHFTDLVRNTVPPIHPAGLPFVGGALAAAVLGRRIPGVRTTGLLAAGATGAFFRHPRRVPPLRPGLVVAPADGEVALIDEAAPPAELGLGDAPRLRVAVFLSIFDVHVQRMPVTARVERVEHRPGAFLSADRVEASDANERTSMLLRTDDDVELVVCQIAGLIARRIVCRAQPGDRLPIGETYGLIRFGSRVDTYLPTDATLRVALGQRTVGAETVLAELR